MVRKLAFIIGIIFAPVANADGVGKIDNSQIMLGDGTQIPHDVLKQCSGIMLFTLEDTAPMMLPNEETGVFTKKLDAYHEKHQLTFKMSDYFSQASEKTFIADGMDFENANYQMGMAKWHYAQQYRDAYLNVLETTGHPWGDDSPFRVTYQADMDICIKLYNMHKPKGPTQ
ncbi:hypothetical protein [Profundibacter amoris]|uniref:Uncharacterized protein n=1 Tax=Profundibacter amoris TaxID=2171755 RepID=A0A347UF19_9RHOB|nr:hypothetical protein [Profundibacter amoris]AXX97447.1 hypothetical protein BAR1_05555 [Profundibacter amoris]